jgi:hypothetical protein
MPYHQFTLARVQEEFGITLESRPALFPDVPSFPLAADFRQRFFRRAGLATTVNTETARTQMLVVPLLLELWERSNYGIALYSGTRFDVDPSVDLVGVCDFIIGRPPQLDYVVAPVMMIVEAKNEQVMGGLGQCAAAMVAAQRFNRTRNPHIETVYGAVSNGSEWRFLRLNGSVLEFDLTDYPFADPDRILGILLHITGITPAAPVAA